MRFPDPDARAPAPVAFDTWDCKRFEDRSGHECETASARAIYSPARSHRESFGVLPNEPFGLPRPNRFVTRPTYFPSRVPCFEYITVSVLKRPAVQSYYV